MKKILSMAFACLAISACSKSGGSADENPSFEAGTRCTLVVSNADAVSKVSSSYDGSIMSFLWQNEDQIKVTVGTSDATFTIKSGAGTASAVFEGEMPAGGNSFSVQYPLTDPDLSDQDYVENGLPQDAMLMTASDCSIDTPEFTLLPQYSAILLNFWGNDRTVGKIVVKNVSTEDSYTLDCGSGVALGEESSPVRFFVVVPVGSYKVEVLVYSDEDVPLAKFISNVMQFNKGKVKVMGKREIQSIFYGVSEELSSVETEIYD